MLKENNVEVPLPQKNLLSTYFLTLMEYRRIEPNFWISEEYFKKANLEINFENGWLWLNEEDVVMFPPLYAWDENIKKTEVPKKIKGYWCDFNNYEETNFQNKKFLDYEYLYDSLNFKKMAGKKWQVFRKNCRKWAKSNLKHLYTDLIKESVFQHKINELFGIWLKNKESDIIEDSEAMLKYIQNGENRKALFNSNNKIVGINIWDENWMYINYRYCITDSREPWVSEYMRLLFYTDPEIVSKNKLVNDGGILGNIKLEKFKNKMNPVRVRSVFKRY